MSNKPWDAKHSLPEKEAGNKDNIVILFKHGDINCKRYLHSLVAIVNLMKQL